MNDSGLISQYGFLYQRKIFVLFVLKSINTNEVFTFEGKDDIEIAPEENIYTILNSRNHCIQVKSGIVGEDCFSRVICNWLLLESTDPITFELALERDLNFDYSSQERAENILKFIIDGRVKKQTSIAKKTYEKFKEQISNHQNEILKIILNMISGFKKSVYSMELIDSELKEKFVKDYCLDIQDFSLAKEKRLERFISYIDKDINDAIKIKKPYTLIYSDFIRYIMQVTEEISDHKYTIDTLCLKKKLKEEAEKIVKDRASREVKQLYLVDNKESFVVDGIVRELIYKDFRDVYAKKRSLEISNLEQNAKENYESTLFTLDDDADYPKKVYNNTISQPLASELLPQGPIYQKGCYIYLTGDKIEDDFQISWGKDNDSE